MKKVIRFSAILLIGIICLACRRVCAQDSGYAHYTSADTALNFSMDYINGWEFNESRGDYGAYAQVVFNAPQARRADFRAGIIVTVEDSAKTFIGASTLEEFMNGVIELRKKLKGFQEVSRSNEKLLDEDARVFDCSYNIPDRLRGVAVGLIPVREKIAVARKNGRFYTVRYLDTEADFYEYAPAFSHILQSLRLQDAATVNGPAARE